MQNPKVRNLAGHYIYLDFLRFLAAVAVMFYHFATANHVVESWTLGTKAAIGTGAAEFGALIPAFSMGWVGVDVFFVISGFVIAMSADGKAVGAFIESRILRLYPVILIATFIAFIVSLCYSRETVLYLSFLGLKQVLLIPKGPWLDGVIWTLIVEVAFYAVIALVMALNLYGRIERIASAWGVVTCLCAIAVLSSHLAQGAAFDAIYQLGVSYLARITLVSTGPYFVLGILIQVVAEKGINRHRSAVLAACFLAGLINIYLAATNEQFYGQGSYSAAVPILIWTVSVIGIAGAAWSRVSPPTGKRLRELARWSGLMTFPLYLIHNTLGAYMLGLLIKAGLAPYAAFCVAAGFAILVSFAISRWLEPRLRSIIKNSIFVTYQKLRVQTVMHWTPGKAGARLRRRGSRRRLPKQPARVTAACARP